MEMPHESEISIISEDSEIEGNIRFDSMTRVHGVLRGEIHAKEGTDLILSESAMVEGKIIADTVLIDGYVRGDIVAKSRVTITRTGRVFGDIKTGSLELEFGAYFEGSCNTQDQQESAIKSDLSPQPV